MANGSSDDEIRKLQHEIRRLEDKVEQRSTLWGRISNSVVAFLLGVSLTLGVVHEIKPPPQVPTGPRVEQPQKLLSYQTAVASIESKLARLSQASQADSLDHKIATLKSMEDDVKKLLEIPCTWEMHKEAFDLIMELQTIASLKVANREQVTTLERRVQRFVTAFKNLCG